MGGIGRPHVPHAGAFISTAAPQYGHGGGNRGKGTVSSHQDEGWHGLEQATSQREPWKRVTFAVPARSCRPSTFCVTSANGAKRRLQRASTSCARFGRQRATSCRRQSYHSQTVFGSRAKASGVASSSGRKSFQRPPGPRNVGTPLAAETPAPVRTVILAPRASRRASERRSSVNFDLAGC